MIAETVKIREITSERDLLHISELAVEWESIAARMISAFSKLKEQTKVEIARDAHRTCGDIPFHIRVLGLLSGEKAIFVSEDTQKRIQGVAFVAISQHSGSTLFLLGVNPDRIKHLNPETPIMGIGTRLIEAVWERVLDTLGRKLWVTSLNSAIPFYEKMGFKMINANNKLMLLEPQEVL